MTVSTNLEIINVSESQAQKAIAANTALLAMELAITDQYNLDTSAATTSGDDVVVPYDNTNDLSDRTALRHFLLTLDAGATAAFDVIHPDNKHLFFVQNNTTQTATVKTLLGTGPNIVTGSTLMCYCDGTNVIGLETVGTLPAVQKEFTTAYFGSPPASVVISKYLTALEATFAADLALSVGNVPVNPAAQYDIDVQDDGVSIGTISISTGGVFTFTTVSGTAKVVAAGSLITLVAPTPADASLTEIHISLLSSV